MESWITELVPDLETVDAIRSMKTINEIRFCVGQPVFIRTEETEYRVGSILNAEQISGIVRAACRQSVYAHTETLCRGYLTLEGGHRMGVCGTGVVREGVVHNLVQPSSLVLRFAREHPGIADNLMCCDDSLLIIGPPGVGKTTLLRDFVRQLSDVKQKRVGLVDERGELSAPVRGKPGMQIGCRTDILVQIPKAEAIMMLLRTMNPQWIAMDEITSPQDIQAIQTASYCGVKLAATAHAQSLDDLRHRPLYRELINCGVFAYVAVIKGDHRYDISEGLL